MNYKQFLLVGLILFVTIANSKSTTAAVEPEFGLVNFMARSNDAMHRNPNRSLTCFSTYIPLVEQLRQQYQANSALCQKKSLDERLLADTATLDKRNDLATLVDTSCSSMKTCNVLSSAENVFQCYIQKSLDDASIMKTINVNASDYLQDLHEEFRLIENRENKCTNDTRRAYENDNTKLLDELNKCILGTNDEPSATTEAAVVTKPTVEPETSESPKNPEESENVQSFLETSFKTGPLVESEKAIAH